MVLGVAPHYKEVISSCRSEKAETCCDGRKARPRIWSTEPELGKKIGNREKIRDSWRTYTGDGFLPVECGGSGRGFLWTMISSELARKRWDEDEKMWSGMEWKEPGSEICTWLLFQTAEEWEVFSPTSFHC